MTLLVKLTHRMRAGAETILACSPEANPLKRPDNRRRCALKSRRTERAAHRHRDEPERAARRNHDESHHPPLRGPGHKKALPI